MTPIQLVTLTLMLEVRLEELSRRLCDGKDISAENTDSRVKKTLEGPENIELSLERDLAIWSLDKRFAQLRYVTAALDRIADGTYGRCLRCDEEIGIARLGGLPHALFCITCQGGAEPGESKELGVLKELVGVQIGI